MLANIKHRTSYRYERSCLLDSQTVRLRPAGDCTPRVKDYSLSITPANHYLHWQRDIFGNTVARVVLPQRVTQFLLDAEFLVDLTPTNPFDFFVDDRCVEYPPDYGGLSRDVRAYFLQSEQAEIESFLSPLSRPKRAVDLLVDVNQFVSQQIQYEIRDEVGVQMVTETLDRRTGSCRDSAWLLVNTMRYLGFAARFVSGYLIQLEGDSESESIELHAWAQAFLPGAGWIGFDPTSGYLAAEGHIALCGAPTPEGAAPVIGGHEPCPVQFDTELTVERLAGDLPSHAGQHADFVQ